MSSNIMLHLEKKETIGDNPFSKLGSHVAYHNTKDPLTLENDIRSVVVLHDFCNNKTQGVPDQQYRESLLTLYRSICLVENRFPVFSKSAYFTWFDAFKGENKATQQNINLEKAAVLFNIGVTCHEMGLGYDRSTITGRRDASLEFIAAASVFSYLKDNVSSKASIEDYTVDVTVECAKFLELVMLAQAQECVCENFFVNQKTTGVVCAKLSRQVGLYYEGALNALNSPPLKDHLEEKWKVHVQLKAAMFYGEACLRHEEKDNTDRAARLTVGKFRLTEAKKSSKHVNTELIQVLDVLLSRLNCKLKEVSVDKDTQMMTSPTSEIPNYSVISSLRDILYAKDEKMFSTEFHFDRTMAFAKYTQMVDEEISRLAGDDVEQQPRGLKRINGEVLVETNKASSVKRLKKEDRVPVVRSKMSAILDAASPTASESSTVSQVFEELGLSCPPPLIHSKLSGYQEVLLLQGADKNLESDFDAFVLQLKKVKEHYEAKDLEACGPVLSKLKDDVNILAAQQELHIATGMDKFLEVKGSLDVSLKGADCKDVDLLSLPYASQLTNVGEKIGSLGKLKLQRLDFTEEAVNAMNFTEMIMEAERAYGAEDFHSCKTLLGRVATRIRVLCFSVKRRT